MQYYLAGGAIRDLLLGRRPAEFDIVFQGTPADMERLYSTFRKVGKTTPAYIVNGYDHMPLVRSVQEDLLARDCTINALIMDENGVVHALPQTFADLRDGIIRHVSETAFIKDPVRVLRAARFTATLPGFSIYPETLTLMREAAQMPPFQKIAAERVGNECMKAMIGHTPSNFLRALAAAGALSPWFDPLSAGMDIPAGPVQYHGETNVFDHIVTVMDMIAVKPLAETDRALAVWMGFCHDIGKLITPPEMLPHHFKHEKRGEEMVEILSKRLKLPNLWNKAGRLAASLHMKASLYFSLRPGTKIDLLHTLAKSRLFIPFCALVEVDTNNERISEMMCRDMGRMLAVKLPEAWRNRGEESSQELRRLRIQTLVDGPGP